MREQLPAEPLVYAAAMYVDAKIVFADRPKRSTYGRLVTEPTLEELDEAFSKQSERNYRLLLPESDKLRQECDSIITENDAFQKYIIDERDQTLVGFIRATSDLALNANLWNLAACPGDDQNALLNALMYHALARLKKELPGCSISISAPAIALEGLKKQGFILDPGGIRAMGLRLR